MQHIGNAKLGGGLDGAIGCIASHGQHDPRRLLAHGGKGEAVGLAQFGDGLKTAKRKPELEALRRNRYHLALPGLDGIVLNVFSGQPQRNIVPAVRQLVGCRQARKDVAARTAARHAESKFFPHVHLPLKVRAGSSRPLH